MKKHLIKILNIFIFCLISGCSFFNKKTVQLAIDSSPQGAAIYIDQQFYGITPTVINVIPKDYIVSLNLNNYGSSSFKTPIFSGSIRTNADGSINADGVRCLLDLTSVIFSFQAYTGKCSDFKQKQYKVTIPKNYFYNSSEFTTESNKIEDNYTNYINNNSIYGAGTNSQNVINYYYEQKDEYN